MSPIFWRYSNNNTLAQRALVLALLAGIVVASIKCNSWALAATAAVFANLTKDQTKSGTIFQDCPVCPQMVVIPAGRFMMGSPETDEDARDNERPQREVTIARPFAVSRFEVTFAEWNTCVDAGGCVHRPNDAGWGQGSRPAMNVSWDDITEQYLPWLRAVTGQAYRLLTEAEWEYAARAGTMTAYSWGEDLGENNANCSDCKSSVGQRANRACRLLQTQQFRRLRHARQCLGMGAGLP